jgi:hypothetical protein
VVLWIYLSGDDAIYYISFYSFDLSEIGECMKKENHPIYNFDFFQSDFRSTVSANKSKS